MTVPVLDIHKILKKLPHRYPILLVDRVVEIELNKSIKALKNVTINEPFFPGHYPHHPVIPGELIIVAMAQTAALLSFRSAGDAPPDGKSVYYFVGIDGARFKRPVVPGDQLIFDVSVITAKRGIWKFAAVARVVGQLAAEAEIMCTVRNVE